MPIPPISMRDRQSRRRSTTRPARPPASPTSKPTASIKATRQDPPADSFLLYTTLALSAFGLFMLYSASARDSIELYGQPFGIALRQFIFFGLGAGTLWLTSHLPYTRYQQMSWRLGGWLGVLLLLLATALLGTTANGSERWLNLGFFQLQPSELAKPVGVILLAFALSRPRGYHWWGTLFLHVMAYLILVGFIFEQPNLSISILMMGTLVALTFVAGLPMMWFLIGLPLGAAGVAWKIMKTPYQLNRILGWQNPWAYPDGIGYNLIHSLFAFGHGGALGTGYGQSIQKQFYLPFHYTDFIFSIIAEELGLVGSIGTVVLYGLLAWRGYTIAWECRNPFGQLLAFGLTSLVVFQAIINLCVATQLFPVTGVTLPLISYGGTSVIVTLAMIGILLNISRFNHAQRSVTPIDQAPSAHRQQAD